MHPILSIDTSQRISKVSVVEGSAVLASVVWEARDCSERLTELIDASAADAGCALRDLGAVAVCLGPGSFTGIRAGIAAAQGLAFGLGLPVAAVSLLFAAALDAAQSSFGLEILGASSPSREGESFVSIYGALSAADAEEEKADWLGLGKRVFFPIGSMFSCLDCERAARIDEFSANYLARSGGLLGRLKREIRFVQLDSNTEDSSVLVGKAAQSILSPADELGGGNLGEEIPSIMRLGGDVQLAFKGLGIQPQYGKSAVAKTLQERLKAPA